MVADGYYYALALVAVALLVGWLAGPLWTLPALLLAFFFLWFFRDPERTIPDSAGAVVSPADGKVTDISSIVLQGVPQYPDQHFSQCFRCPRKSFSADRRDPGSSLSKGKISQRHESGLCRNNEQNAVTVEGDGQTVIFKQIAGLLARRIVFNQKVGDQVERGQRVGLIKFGSRVDVVLESSATMQVKVGDRVKGGASVLAYFRLDHLQGLTVGAAATRQGAL